MAENSTTTSRVEESGGRVEEEMAPAAERGETRDAAEAEKRREELLTQLKREVKQLMEEAVTRRFIHEESSLVTSLSAAVEACLAHGMRRRVLGLFGASSTFALLHKIAKLCPPANSVVRSVLLIQQGQMKKRNSSSSSQSSDFPPNTETKDSSLINARYLWIRVALFEKLLSTIIDYVARNANKYYGRDALMADSVRGSMVASLLVGPCALEFSKMKTMDHYWTDPPANELLQRNLLNRSVSQTSPKSPRPPLQMRRMGSVNVEDTLSKLPSSARDYVMSLHQNTKSSLLYGKNNVSVCPVGHTVPMKGYLSLHHNVNGTLIIKWTPNELMHSDSVPEGNNSTDKNAMWNYALNINVQEVVYLHFHQQGESGGSIVFVGADGVQHPPLTFPSGQHPLAFLSCLENGLLPWGQLDPPLWLQRGKGKVFPKLRRRSLANGRTAGTEGDEDADTTEMTHDYVFRVIPVNRPTAEELRPDRQPLSSVQPSSRLVSLSSLSSRLKGRFMSLSSSTTSSPPPTPKTGSSCGSGNEDEDSKLSLPSTPARQPHHPVEKTQSEPMMLGLEKVVDIPIDDDLTRLPPSTRKCIRTACESMRYQILSRAFYGWLAHCRHLKTIRTHLSCLVHRTVVPNEDAAQGLTSPFWNQLFAERTEKAKEEMFRLVYSGGMDPELRPVVWPYLLELVPWNEDMADHEERLRLRYEGIMTEWIAVEAIVRQRDKEIYDAARNWREKKDDGSACLTGKDASLCNEVFDDETENAASDEEEKKLEETMGEGDGDDSGLGTNNSEELPPSQVASGRSTPEAGEGGIYSKELVDTFALNLHRIEKDVQRCDRNHPYFTPENLEKLRNLMCSYVWENLHCGYVQGMCDLAAPLLVTFNDEVLTYGCFTKLMERMGTNFPHGGGMDEHLANMRSLIQVMDPELFDLMRQNGDYTHFYFCYRWFLLDFKRELAYEDVFLVWEVIWAANRLSSAHFILFLALSFLLLYRDIILDNNMDFTDIIKFFNEMAEKHDARSALNLSRSQVRKLQLLIETDRRS